MFSGAVSWYMITEPKHEWFMVAAGVLNIIATIYGTTAYADDQGAERAD